MLSIKIGEKIYNLPETISEITLGQYLDLKATTDKMEQLGIILNNNAREFDRLPANDKTEQQVNNALAMLNPLNSNIEDYKSSEHKVSIPKMLDLEGQTLKVPQDIYPEPFGARMHVKNRIQEIAKDNTKADEYMVDILAHYLYVPWLKVLTKEPAYYHESRAEDFKEVVRSLPLDTAIQLNNFFLTMSREVYRSKWHSLKANLTLFGRRLAYKYSTSTGT